VKAQRMKMQRVNTQRVNTPLVIMGPTGVGKSQMALELAQVLDGEIINADSAQMYTPLTIGTAKPAYDTSTIPHHCYDIIDEPVHYSVMQYRQKLMETVADIQKRNKVPIIVGGSGFYIKSLLFPPAIIRASSSASYGVTSPPQSLDTFVPTAEILDRCRSATWDQLNTIDAVRAAQLHPHDTYRIGRALAIWYTYGVKPSECNPVYEPWTDMIVVWLTRDRQELYAGINKRVVAMIDAGWIKEVAALRNTRWESFMQGKKIIGYDLILSMFAQEQKIDSDLEKKLVEQIQQKTRNYAKGQMIFWKSLKKQIEAAQTRYQGSHRITITEIDLTLAAHDLYINQLLKIYMNKLPEPS
jgi:tRNA dimethylallyltransferase